MAIGHDFEVVSKEVVFSEGEPTSPLKLFEVTGDVMASIIPVIRVPFSTEDAILKIGEQGKPITMLYMDSKYKDIESRTRYPISSDIYLNVSGASITSGTVVFYCTYAKLSEDGGVEVAE